MVQPGGSTRSVETADTRWSADELGERQPLVGDKASELGDTSRGVVVVQDRTIPCDKLDVVKAQACYAPNSVFIGRIPLERPDSRAKLHGSAPYIAREPQPAPAR